MKIIRVDGERHERVVGEAKDRDECRRKLAPLVAAELRRIPNDPHYDASAVNEVSVYIGVTRIVSFRVDGW